PKISALSQLRKDRQLDFEIEIDGGVNEETAKRCIDAGADVLVAGSAIYNQPDYKAAIDSIRGASRV
ncbi:MAG: ribulose-phosphate 3-epimerase, partial [Exiguobacterium sp.]|nr:ribulose-phosphate 3-epimerase [Exiguobacterium sp.]